MVPKIQDKRSTAHDNDGQVHVNIIQFITVKHCVLSLQKCHPVLLLICRKALLSIP